MTNASLTVKEISQGERVPERIVLDRIRDGALKARDASEKASNLAGESTTLRGRNFASFG
jgi:hypothetical protein